MAPLPYAVDAYLQRHIADIRPQRLLVIAEPDYSTADYVSAAGVDCHCHVLTTAAAARVPDRLERYDMTLAIDPTAAVPRRIAMQLLGHLRDIVSGHLLVVAARTAHGDATEKMIWQPTDFIELGFRRAEASAGLDAGFAIYRHDIRDYKITPSWLSARHWANPERWDKERW